MGNADLTSAVRRVLVKNWLDMGKIRIQVAGSTVIIRGRIVKSRADEPVSGMVIEDLDTQVRATKGVKNLRWALEDWAHDRGKWKRRQA